MEIVVASGKGGTGKTLVASNLLYYLASVASAKCAGVDADVEAPDLAAALGGYATIEYEASSYAARRPRVRAEACTGCGRCASACRSGAIELRDGVPAVDADECEGCGVCAAVCPSGAIEMVEHRVGRIVAGTTRCGVAVVSGELEPGEGSSGRLVHELRSEARRLYRGRAEFVVVDAAAGIGCPVISSMVGADLVVVVVEPTPQSAQGARRLRSVAEALRVRHVAVLNKWDLDPRAAGELEREFDVVGRVPFDAAVFESYASSTPLLLRHPGSRAARALVEAFEAIVGR